MNNSTILTKILSDIKLENSKEWRVNENKFMSSDDSNECILGILRRNIDIADVDDIEDSEDFLSSFFGQDGLDAIREAETGLY